MAAAPGYTQLPVAPYAHAQPLTGAPHPGHPHPSFDGTAPPSTMQTTGPRRSGVLWLGVILALFGLGALAVVFLVPQLSTGRSSARDAGDRDEPAEDDDARARDEGNDADEPVATKADAEALDDKPAGDKPSPGKTGVAPKPSKPADKPATTDDKPTAEKPTEDKPTPPVPEEPPCKCPDYRPANMTCKPSETLKACSPVTSPNACCPAGYVVSPYPGCSCMFDACKLPGSPCNK